MTEANFTPFDPDDEPTIGTADRRASSRVEPGALVSSVGPILDLSGSGMRVEARDVPKHPFTVEIRHEGERHFARAEMVWSKRVGFRRREAGIRFLNVDPALAETLTRIAMESRRRADRALRGRDGGAARAA